jgi:hypothetical protein
MHLLQEKLLVTKTLVGQEDDDTCLSNFLKIVLLLINTRGSPYNYKIERNST